MEKCAIIGAGPGGIIAACELKKQGIEPTLFESHESIGGQWNISNENSGLWPQMRTNTYLEATRFSDVEFPPGTALFPRNTEVLAYLRGYAEKHGVLDQVRCATECVRLERARKGWRLTLRAAGGAYTMTFPKVVVASGRYNKPYIPWVLGRDGFSGEAGIRHTFHYRGPEAYRGKHVVVAGGAISALEIASDLAMFGAASVHLAQRRQRYVLPKITGGTVIEYFVFTYRQAELALDGSKEDREADQRAVLLEFGGDPARYGAPPAHPDISRAGATGSQHYLPLIAEDRLTPVPWIREISGRTVVFECGRSVVADAILFATGFDLDLPFLSEEIGNVVGNDAKGLQLADFTFHPDLPGLAFVGLWSQQGAYAVPLEQQARYIAYTWGGVIPARSGAQLRRALNACGEEEHHSGYQTQNAMALRFARLSGTDPAALDDPPLLEKIRKSATTGILYRLTGPGSHPNGKAAFLRQFDRYAPLQHR